MRILKIVTLASILTSVCGTRYAYIDNKIIEYEDRPTQAFSLPFPYGAPKIMTNEKRSRDFENIDGAQTSDVLVSTSTVKAETEKALSSPMEPSPLPIEPSPSPLEPNPLPTGPSPSPIEQSPLPIEPSPSPIGSSPSPIAPSPSQIEPSPSPIEASPLPIGPSPSPIVSSPSAIEPSPSPIGPSPSPIEPNPSPIGTIYPMVSLFTGFVKRFIMKVVINITTNILSFFSTAAKSLSSLSKHYDIDVASNVAGLSFVTADRLKRATTFLETQIKRLKSV